MFTIIALLVTLFLGGCYNDSTDTKPEKLRETRQMEMQSTYFLGYQMGVNAVTDTSVNTVRLLRQRYKRDSSHISKEITKYLDAQENNN